MTTVEASPFELSSACLSNPRPAAGRPPLRTLPEAGPGQHWAADARIARTNKSVRGLHGEDMTKLIGVASGTAFGAYVDTRTGSASFGRVETVELAVGTQVLVPRGVCNGFQATSEDCQYLCAFDEEWSPHMAGSSITPLDRELAIPWPIEIDPTDRRQISEKDRDAPEFSVR